MPFDISGWKFIRKVFKRFACVCAFEATLASVTYQLILFESSLSYLKITQYIGDYYLSRRKKRFDNQQVYGRFEHASAVDFQIFFTDEHEHAYRNA